MKTINEIYTEYNTIINEACEETGCPKKQLKLELKRLYEKAIRAPKHVADLTEAELKKLRQEIVVGSYFMDDYENSFDIDTDEVYAYAEGYEEYLYDEDLEDTLEEFADYCSLTEDSYGDSDDEKIEEQLEEFLDDMFGCEEIYSLASTICYKLVDNLIDDGYFND